MATQNNEKYIDKDDYKVVKGIDLDIELQDDDEKSNKTKRFIIEVTNWCCDYLARNYGCNDLNRNLDNWDKLALFRKIRFREGVIEQIEYILDNGWINKDSGINTGLGTIMDYRKVELGRNAYEKFYLGAFCNIQRGAY